MSHDLDIAIRFLTKLRWRGPWTLSAIYPDGSNNVPTETFITKEEIPLMREWIANMNSRAGVYFVANPTLYRMHKRPTEADIGFAQYITLDFDPLKTEAPTECRARVFKLLAGYALQPTLLWTTGNGVQCAWQLKPVVKLKDKQTALRCKRAARGLIQALGSDTTQSLEHLYRIPGTVNYPSKIKRAAGRKIVRAGDFTYHAERVYTLDDFSEPTGKAQRNARGLAKPLGGWDTKAGINDAILYFKTTRDLAAEGRSGTAIRTASRARDYGVSEELCFDLMLNHWCPRCEYVWDDVELRGKVKRAYEGAQNDPGCLTIEYRLAEAREEFRL